jgi:DNA invertase Pin-like site-specific DNA recombinase
MTKNVAIYVRVSTDKQSIDNQRLALQQAADMRGWTIVAEYADEGISGAKARDKRPGLDQMLTHATQGKFKVIMAWALDRIGRSVPDLYSTMQELRGAGVDMFLHQQALDTTTDVGRAMYGMLSVFAEFERSMISTRVQIGMQRAKADQDKARLTGGERLHADGTRKKLIGRPALSKALRAAVIQALDEGLTQRAAALQTGVNTTTIRRLDRELRQVSPRSGP